LVRLDIERCIYTITTHNGHLFLNPLPAFLLLSSEMPPSLDVSSARILELWIGSVFWGIFLITFYLCMRSLLFDESSDSFTFKKKEHIHWPMVIVALLLFTFATCDIVNLLVMNLKAFVWKAGAGSDAVFEDASGVSSLLGVSVHVPV
jgi:hypothetical protein